MFSDRMAKLLFVVAPWYNLYGVEVCNCAAVAAVVQCWLWAHRPWHTLHALNTALMTHLIMLPCRTPRRHNSTNDPTDNQLRMQHTKLTLIETNGQESSPNVRNLENYPMASLNMFAMSFLNCYVKRELMGDLKHPSLFKLFVYLMQQYEPEAIKLPDLEWRKKLF